MRVWRRGRVDATRKAVGHRWLWLALAAWSACSPQCPSTAPTAAGASSGREKPHRASAPAPSLELSRRALREAGAPPQLLAQLDASPMRYFRLLADAYEHRVCDAFHARSGTLPIVAVHGDPHIEQFVVTGSSYGLEDFDRAGFGPSVVDQVRYAASLHVACEVASFPCDANAAVERYLAAYRHALSAPPAPDPTPAVVSALRSRVPSDHRAWLEWADSLMDPFDASTQAAIRNQWSEFVDVMAAVRPDLPSSTFDIVKSGTLSMGIGSALERKMLFRVAGPSDAPEDDLLIEARQGSPPGRGGCVWHPDYGQSLILMFTAVLGRRMPEIHGFVPLLDARRRFWVQDWDQGYVELSVTDVTSQRTLEELATDAGKQLAGHLWSKFPAELLPYQLHAQREAFDQTRPQVVLLAGQLASETVNAWQRFRSGSGPD